MSDNIKMSLKKQDWIYLAQDRDNWKALVNMIMNLWVPYNVGNFMTSEKTTVVASHKGICSMELVR
jgi:hypothetical protein